MAAISSSSSSSSTKSSRRVFVVGVGMTNFEKPGSREWDYPHMIKEAVTKALTDLGLPYDVIEQAAAGYCYGDSTCGQRGLYEVGITGIPIYNVNNNCSTGSTALYMANQFIKAGNDCVLAFGFEKMERGSLKAKYEDRTNPMDKHGMIMAETHGFSTGPMAAQLFGNAGREHMKLYGTRPEHFAKIAEKNHKHSVNNPYSQFKDVYTLDQILKSPKVHEPLTKLQCCPTSEGAAAAVLCSEEFVYRYGLQNQAVEIGGMSMATDTPSTFQETEKERAMIRVVGFDMTRKAAEEVYRQSGLGPKDVQVIELHDCFSANELLTYEALGLCPIGGAGALIDAGDVTYGGKWVVNPSGGLISKGHPLGATGLAQCAELTWQIRGLADKRQVKNVKAALQHNLGLGGAAVVTLYKKATFGAVPTSFPRSRSSVGVAPQGVPEGIPAPVLATPAPKPEKKEKKAAATTATATAPSSSSGGASSAAGVFADLKKRLSPELVKKVQVVYRFDLEGAQGKKSYLVDLKNGNGDIREAEEKADCIMSMKEDDFVRLMNGKLDAQQAFMKGAIKIKGNMMLAQKLQLLSKPQSAL